MKWPFPITAVAATLALFATAAGALEKTVVGVRLTVPHPGVISSLGPDTTRLVGQFQTTAANALARKFPFVTFVPGNAPRYVFTMRLANRNESQTRGVDEMGFHVGLLDRGTRGPEIFRAVRALGDPPRSFGAWDVFALELETVLRTFDERAVVESVLARVSIADSAFCWPNPVGWVLPFGRADLCLGDDTKLTVSTEMPSGVSRRTPFKFTTALAGEFTRTDLCGLCGNRLFSMGLAPAAALDSAKVQRDSVRTLGVYVSKMERLDPCPVLPAPGGGQP